MTRKEAVAEAGRRNLEHKDAGVWAAQRAHGDDWRVVRLITSGIGRREPRRPAAAREATPTP